LGHPVNVEQKRWQDISLSDATAHFDFDRAFHWIVMDKELVSTCHCAS